MLLSATGAPADASALQRFQQAYDSENQPHPAGRMVGATTLNDKAAAAFDRVLAVRSVARQLAPLAKAGWLVLPSIRFEGDESDELDFFLLAPSGQAYALLVQRYAGARMKASGSEAYGNGHRDSLPQAVQDRTNRVQWLLKTSGISVVNVTPVAVLVDVETLRYWGPKFIIVTPDWKLVRELQKREKQLLESSGWAPVRDERLLSPEFWGEESTFSQAAYLQDRALHQRVARQLAQGRIFQRVWLAILIALGAGLLTWVYLNFVANQQLQIMTMN